MCGICGIWRADPGVNGSEAALAQRMSDSLTHRGPDDHGVWHDGRVALAHRRLSIIDLSPAGRQPMGNEDGSVQIAYNGEVYNFRELKQRFDLEGRGHRFRSATDTEVLVHLYEELGIDMVKELNGMFAFAIWDARSEQLHLARDRYGIKPLFYTWHDERLLFGSEIKALLCDASVPRRVNVQALHDFLSLNYMPGEQTAFDGIYELPPAHCLSIESDGTHEVRRYWDLDFETDEGIDEETAVQQARHLMDQAVRRQLVSDVPVGVMLSGGLDSSTIVALMSGHHREPVRTYSVGFDDASFNEIPYARIVAEQYNTVHREVVVRPEHVRQMLPGYLKYIDEPYGDGSAIPTYYVCQMAKDEVGVVLSGEGGDEVFAGYETYSAYQVARWCRRVPRWIRQGIVAPLVNRLPVSHKKLSFEFKAKRFLGGLDLPPADAHLWWRVVLTEAEKAALYADEVREQMQPAAATRHFAEVFARSGAGSDLNRLLHVDSSVFLPDDLMIKNDRMSMAHSLEARVPMTDTDLAEFMARVPARVKFPRLRKKHVMRRAMQDALPATIINKKKVGLEMPYSRWLKHELNDLLRDYCGPQRIADSGLFKPGEVSRLIDEHVRDRRDHGRALWGLLNYMMWHEEYIA